MPTTSHNSHARFLLRIKRRRVALGRTILRRLSNPYLGIGRYVRLMDSSLRLWLNRTSPERKTDIARLTSLAKGEDTMSITPIEKILYTAKAHGTGS
jgi:hypothetical protein